MINFIHAVIISSMRQNHYYFQQWCTFNFADKNLFNAEESIFFSSLTDHCSLSVCWEILKQNPLRNCCPLVIYDSEKTHVVTTSKPRLIDKGLANPRTLYPIPNFTTEKMVQIPIENLKTISTEIIQMVPLIFCDRSQFQHFLLFPPRYVTGMVAKG